MVLKAGIPLVELFSVTDQINAVLPKVIQDFIGRFSVIEHTSTRSSASVFHYGKVQALTTVVGDGAEELDIGIGKLAIPLIHGGLPFQLSMARSPVTSNLEPAAQSWQLDLNLTDFALTLDGLDAATYVAESGTVPRHLVRGDSSTPVRIIGSAVLRIEKSSPTANVEIKFIDKSDPLDPTLSSGAVAELSFSPPHFFLGKSEFGLSVGRLQFDFSETYSPPNILEQNQGPSWVGLAIQEATVYAPRNLPLIGDLSGGIKNVLFGRPMGVQGEFEIQFGRSALDPTTFQFKQDGDDDFLAIGGSGVARTVTIEAGHEDQVSINVGFTTPGPPADGTDWSAIWRWPDETVQTGDSSSGRVVHGQALKVTPVETVTVGGTPTSFNHPEITFRFAAAGTAPAISTTISGEEFANLIHLNGPADSISALTFTATSTAAGSSEFEWELPGTGVKETGASYQPDFSGLSGQQWIILREQVEGEQTRRVTRLRIQLTDEGSLLLGCEDGVFNESDASTALTLSEVDNTFDLSDFHAQGAFNTKLVPAVLDASEDANVRVPVDSLAQVVISSGGAAAENEYDRHVQIEMVFEEDTVTNWGEKQPERGAGAAANDADLQGQLLEWASHYPGAEFIVIGRCDDIGRGVSLGLGEDPDPFNISLAHDRAVKGKSLLTSLLSGAAGTPIDGSRVIIRGESALWAVDTDGDALEEDGDIDLTQAQKSEAVADSSLMKGWLIKYEYREQRASENWVSDVGWNSAASYETIRRKYRRVDIYAVGGTPTDEAITGTASAAVSPTLRRSMVPANDRTPTAIPSSAPAIDYRVKLKIVWDSPTVTEWRDAIPTLAEAEFVWTPAEMPIPAVGEGADAEAVELSRETLTVYAKWVHDSRTEFTKATLGIRSDGDPDGLASTGNKQLAAAAALGPMLLSGVDLENDVVGSGARIAALVAAAGFAGVDMGDGPLVGDDSKTALIAIEAEAQTRALSDPTEDYQISLTVEYVCTLHINGGVMGIKTAADKPVKIRYKNVGLEFDNQAEGWNKVGIAYATDSMEIEDPGKWEISGVLGSLLRIVEISFGRGSLWIEGRIAIAINIGVVEISEAIIRLTWKDGDVIPSFELRGFVLKADIPNVLKGEGRLRIEDGGVIRAGIEASIIPLGLGASAAIALAKPPEIDPAVFLSLYLGVQFSTPLPLAQSGAAIYGFKGQFTMNGSRKLGSSPDPIKRELDWWAVKPEDKYEPDLGQYAIGVGVVVGTMPDVSFAFSASGMVVVAFPDPEVIIGVDVKIIEVPNTQVTDEGGTTGTITGLIIIDDEAVKVAVSAQYTIPKVLKLKVPFGAYFPYSGEGIYVRLGCDGQTEYGRYGEPITLQFLPGTLNVQAWAYLMIEQDGLPFLGGKEQFSFKGFSIGFGAGWGIEWKAGPIKLSASAKVLVGFGTKPLLIKGGVFVAGELDLVVVSISARGELILTYFNENIFLEGKFCGEVDLFFFSIKGCVGVSIGSKSDSENIPPPEPPVTGISLIDRNDRIMGEVTTNAANIQAQAIFAISDEGVNNGAAVEDNNTVWADTAPVLRFSHYVKNSMPDTQFSSASTPSQPIWFGGNRLKYTYRLDNIILRRKNAGALVSSDSGKLKTVWMTSPYRQPDSSEDDNPVPSEHEGPNLKLLDWNPWNWVVNMDDGGSSTDGDPARGVEDLCDPVPQPRRACVFGFAARSTGWYAVRLRQQTPAEPPYPSQFFLTGEPVVRSGDSIIKNRDLMSLAIELGATLRPGYIADLPFDITLNSQLLKKGYRLPFIRKALDGGMLDIAIPWEARFDRELSRPVVTLLVCDADAQVGDRKKECVEFEGVKPSGQFADFTHKGFRFISRDPANFLILVDMVDTTTNPDRKGSDGNADILIPKAGMDIVLPFNCSEVELHFLKFNRGGIFVEAENSTGQKVDSDTANGPENVPVKVKLNAASGIQKIRISGTDGKAVLYRICCAGEVDVPAPAEKDPQCEDFRDLRPQNKAVKEIRHNGYIFRPVKSANRLMLMRSDVIDQTNSTAVRGRDGGAEIQFPAAGMNVKLANPCGQVELWFMLLTSEVITVVGLDSNNKKVASAVTSRSQRVAQRLLLSPENAQLIVRLEVSGGGGESVLFKICCKGEKEQVDDCRNFAGLKLPGRGVREFKHLDMVFVSIDKKPSLKISDFVDDTKDSATVGRDRIPELRFGDEGLRIILARPCDRVTLKAMLFGGALKAQALTANGARVQSVSSTAERRVEQALVFTGKGIQSIEVFGGDNRAVLFEICCTEQVERVRDSLPSLNDLRRGLLESPDVMRAASGETAFTSIAARAQNNGLFVRGIIDNEIKDNWPGKLIRSQGKCQIISFEPEKIIQGGWNGFQLVAPRGKKITLLSVCGIDQAVVNRRNEDAANRAATLVVVNDILSTAVEDRREVLLEPGAEYEITVEWSYQHWQSNEDGSNEPPATPDGTWKSGVDQSFYFAVAAEDISTGNTQDGLNEYVFDARDVNRHLLRVEPADGRSVHFTDDPVWAHFDAGHIEQLLDQYGRQLQIEVTRTDPPPQSSPALLLDILSPLLPLAGTLGWSTGPVSLMPSGYQRINEAIAEAPCLSGEPAVGGASLSAQYDLQPNAMYDLRIIAPKTDASEPAVVSATRFITSRFANPEALIESLGFKVGSRSPYRVDDIIIPPAASLPGGSVEVSDSLLDDLLREMQADTLPLPQAKAVCYAVWRQVGANWLLEGLLIDSLESLNRSGAVKSGSGSEIVTRCKVKMVRIEGGHTMTVRRANENWTRVFLKPNTAISLSGEQLDLNLEFETSSGVVTGQRIISAVPAIIDREGL